MARPATPTCSPLYTSESDKINGFRRRCRHFVEWETLRKCSKVVRNEGVANTGPQGSAGTTGEELAGMMGPLDQPHYHFSWPCSFQGSSLTLNRLAGYFNATPAPRWSDGWHLGWVMCLGCQLYTFIPRIIFALPTQTPKPQPPNLTPLCVWCDMFSWYFFSSCKLA